MKNLFTILIILANLTSFAQEFHVTTTGDDGAAGTSDAPWESIQHAMDNATPGSTVLIHEGTYNEKLYVNVSGNEASYTTFKAFDDDEDVIVDGSGIEGNALLEIYNIHHVAIESIKFTNNVQLDAIGIIIEGACDHIRIEDCDVSNIKFSEDPNAPITEETNAQGIIVYGSEAGHTITDLEILDNEIYDCVLGYSEALAVNGNVDGFVIAENEVHDVTNIGIDIIGHEGVCDIPQLDQARNGVIIDNETYNCQSPYATAAGIYVDGGKSIIIERNIVHDNQWGIEIGAENNGTTTEDIVVRNNFIYNNTTAGIACGGYDYPITGSVVNCVISNNTLFGNDTENDFTGELYLSYNEGLMITNNIFYSTASSGVMFSDENLAFQSEGLFIFNNLWYHTLGEGNIEFAFEGEYYNTLEEFITGTGFGGSSIWADPSLVNTGVEPDLHLTASSPAKDYGNGFFTNIGDSDIDGGNRIVGGNIDLGADEFGSSVGIVENPISELSFYPNPVANAFNIQMKDATITQVVITDIHAKRVLEITNLTQTNLPISIHHLNAGIYIIQAWDQDSNLFQNKLIKE